MAACQTENNDQKNLEGSLGEILEQIYDNADVDASFRDFVRKTDCTPLKLLPRM
jgi:2-hydroxy-3-keto-5-methylthiopentenyl-1-phosphate phosphatase